MFNGMLTIGIILKSSFEDNMSFVIWVSLRNNSNVAVKFLKENQIIVNILRNNRLIEMRKIIEESIV